MKCKTLSALGIAAALACSAASATTFLCETDPSDLSYKSCTQVSDLIASRPVIQYVPASEPAYVTYYRIERASPEVAGSSSRLPSEPPAVTYYFSFDSAVNNALK